MGLMSEVCASIQAGKLKNVLSEARKQNNNDVILFCKNNILPLYLDSVDEAWEHPDKDLVEFFNNYK